jgi:hypothetical protein
VIENDLMKYEMYRLHHAVSVVLLTALLAGAGCKNNDNKLAAQQADAAKPSPTPSKRLIKKAGWQIPGLEVARVTMPLRLLPSAGNSKVYLTWLKPRPKAKVAGQVAKITDLPTLKSYLAEEELKELGITAKQPHILSLVKYDLGDRPFCYVVKYRSHYAVEALHYYDEDGDKSFELVETGTPSPEFVPRIPGWTQQ